MKSLFSVLICTLLLLMIGHRSNGQITVTGKNNTTPNLAAIYSTLDSAIRALNTITAISGPVTIQVTASSYTETAPVGGYQITMNSITNTNSSPVIIDGNHQATITAFTPQVSNTLTDAIFKIIGADYVTIQKFTMKENPSNTNSTIGSNNMTEWGVALLHTNNTNGAQNNSIIDNDISLDKSYENTFGIYSSSRHSATNVTSANDVANGTTAPNHGNKVYNNRISNVNMGIMFSGSNTDSRMDSNNDIGGSSSSTGNTITNWGGSKLATGGFMGNVATEYYGILLRCQKDDNTSWNTVTSSTSLSCSSAVPIRGIHRSSVSGSGAVTGNFAVTINNNTIAITDNLPNGSSTNPRVIGISCTDKYGTATVSITNNTINGLYVTTTSSNQQIRGIHSEVASAGSLYINNNTIKGNTSTATAGYFIGIDQTGTVSDIVEINDNMIGDYSSTTPAITFSATAGSNTIVRGISYTPTTSTGSVSVSGNSFYGFVHSNSSSADHTYIQFNKATTTSCQFFVDGNHFINLSPNITGDVIFINSFGSMSTGAGAQISVSNNDITGTFTKGGAGGHVYIYSANGSSGTGNTMTESGNNFSSITLSGSATMYGWYNNEGVSAAGPEKHITQNVFDTWTCNTSGTGSSNGIYCDWASGNSEISRNIISNISSYASLCGIVDASGTATIMTYDGNQISGLSSNSVLYGIDIRGGGNVGRTLLNSAITLFSTTGTLVFGVQWSSPFLTGSGFNLDVYYNTIYLSATSTSSVFTSSCLAVVGNGNPANNTSRVRNNIFINNSVPKTNPLAPTSIGKSSIMYNQGAVGQIANYHSSSNNNTFWLGTPVTATSPTSTAISNSTHVIYQDGPTPSPSPGPVGVDKVTLLDFQGYVSATLPLPGGAESLSVLVMPEFNNAILPVSMSDNAIDLHLLSSCGTTGVNNAYIFNHGNNQGILALTDWPVPPPGGSNWPVLNSGDGDARLTVSPFVTDIGADQHIRTYTWTGAAGPAWNNNSNWTPSQYPDNSEANVYIPKATGSHPQPVIANGDSWQVDNVFFQTGLSSLVLPLLTNSGTLKVAGGQPFQTAPVPLQVPAIRGDAGSFSNYNAAGVVVGSIEMNSACRIPAQTLGGLVFVNKKVFDLRIRNNVNISSVSNNGVKVVRELNFGSLTGLTLNTGLPTLDNDENLTMVSTIDRTANVASVTGNTITGDVTVERYINTGTDATTTPPQHHRSWQLLSTPTSGQSVRQSWMENMASANDNLHPGFGTNIAGQTGFADGFDQPPYPTNNDGIKWWDYTVGPPVYRFLSNTSVPLNKPQGYFLFVRGDRSVINFSGTLYLPVPTTLRQKGPLYQTLNPPITVSFASGTNNPNLHIIVGNPYASAIDLNAMISTGGFNNIGPNIYVYDPYLGSVGGWQLLNATTGFTSVIATPTPYYTPGVQYPYIESGNAFDIKPASAASGYIKFTEAVKSGNQRLANRTGSFIDSVKMNATLYLPGDKVADGNVAFFASTYSNASDSNDVTKLFNFGENFFITQDTGTYIVAKRDVIGASDSIFYSFSNLDPETYKLKFAPYNLYEVGLTARLIDNYLDTSYSVALDAETEISFVVDSTLGSMQGRFTLVFSRASKSSIAVVPTESFQKVFPNPVTNKKFFIELNNEFSGNCNIQVVNSVGQVIVNQMATQVKNQKAILVNLEDKVPAGVYHVVISDEKGKKTSQNIIVR